LEWHIDNSRVNAEFSILGHRFLFSSLLQNAPKINNSMLFAGIEGNAKFVINEQNVAMEICNAYVMAMMIDYWQAFELWELRLTKQYTL
jgi:hypothetical protein